MYRQRHLFLAALGVALSAAGGSAVSAHDGEPAAASPLNTAPTPIAAAAAQVANRGAVQANPPLANLPGDVMEPPSDAEMEKLIQAKGLTAPRLTPELIQAVIADETYTRLEGTNTTVCRLQLANGFCVVGVNNGPVSAANFDQEIGCQYAYKAAVQQIWTLEGYLLAQRLHELAQPDVSLAASRLRLAQSVLALHAPPDGISDADALNELYGVLDQPLPGVAPASHQDRVRVEKSDLEGRLEKLCAFFDTPTYAALPDAERHRLQDQHDAMRDYSDVLAQRIAAF